MALRLSVETASGSISAHEFVFDQPEVTIGRSPECHVQLPLLTISSHHLTLLKDDAAYFVTDAGSTNGTFLNDVPLEPHRYTPITSGDVLRLTDALVTFSVDLSPDLDTSEEITAEMMRALISQFLIGQSIDLNDTRPSLKLLQSADTTFKIEHASLPLTVGTQTGLNGHLPHPELPEIAFRIEARGNTWVLIPGDHNHPIQVNNVRVTGEHVRLRTGSHVQLEDLNFLFTDPIESLLSNFEDSHSASGSELGRQPHVPGTTKDFSLSLTAEYTKLSPTETGQFQASNTARTKHHAVIPPPTPSIHYEPALASAGVAESQRNIPARSSSWTRTDIALLLFAITLTITAVFIFLVLFSSNAEPG